MPLISKAAYSDPATLEADHRCQNLAVPSRGGAVVLDVGGAGGGGGADGQPAGTSMKQFGLENEHNKCGLEVYKMGLIALGERNRSGNQCDF